MGSVSIEAEMARDELPGGTVTFVLADVEGSTGLWESDADGMSASMERLRALTEAVISEHGGARPEEQGEGDSFVAAFPRASDAVSAALGLQLALLGETWPGPQISMRIGVHTGEARFCDEGRNYAGEAMNRCARLRAVGHGGQTLISQATYELIADRPPAGTSLVDRGSHRLRDLRRPERVWQLCHPDLPEDFPPLLSLESIRNNLPPQLTSFVGRDEEIEAIRSFVSRHRVVTLTGAGGVGKTRLAIEAGATLLAAHPDGVWWVDLSSVNSPEVVVQTVAQVAGVPESPTRSPMDTLVKALKESAVLVVLDNCEHLTEMCAELTEQLVKGCPRVSILSTSREPLGVAGELPWKVPSLGIPRDDEQVADSDAVRLFAERAVSSRPNFRITEENAAHIAEICRQLDGIPLAIELAAARVRVLTPKQIAAGLSDRFHLLTGGGPRAMPRQRTLEASVDWSYNLLSEEERILLRRLSVFTGGFTLDAAEAVCAGNGVEAYHVLDLLTALVDRSLAHMNDDDDELARYRLLETIRQYGAQRLVDAGEGPALGRKHLEYYLAFAEALTVESDQTDEALTTFDAEHDNLRAAIDWAVRDGDTDRALAFVSALGPFWSVRGHGGEASRRFDTVLAMEDGDPLLRARALAASTTTGITAGVTGNIARSEEALALARSLGDRSIEARALIGIGLSTMLSDSDRSRAALDEAIPIALDLGDSWAVWWSHTFRGWLDFQAGDLAAARSYIEPALAISTGTGVGRSGRMVALCWLGGIEVYEGNLDAGERALEEAAALGRAGSFGAMGPMLMAGLAQVAALRGEREKAVALYDEMERLAQQQDFPDINLVMHRPIARGLRGDIAGAVDDFEAAINVFRAMRFNWVASLISAGLGFRALTQGRLDDMQKRLDEATGFANEISNPYGLVVVDYVSGLRAAVDGDLDEAEEHFHDSLARALGCSLGAAVTNAFEEIAALNARRGRAEESARLFGYADAARRRQGHLGRGWFFFIGDDGAPLDTTSDAMSSAREALGDEAFDAAWAEGAAMSRDEAVAYVQRGRGPRKRPSAGWSSLSPRELDVARLVAQGLTNPEIGEKLFLSKRTVQTHLSHIFAKVGVGSRAELASEATRREI